MNALREVDDCSLQRGRSPRFLIAGLTGQKVSVYRIRAERPGAPILLHNKAARGAWRMT
jgi:hypothetical protein